MDGQKTVVRYAGHDPMEEHVGYVTINYGYEAGPFVFATYGRHEDESRLPRSSDIITLPIRAARAIFEFRRVDEL